MTKRIAIGAKVKLKGNPYDEQIAHEAMQYANVKESIQIVTEVKDVREMKGTSGWWIKTDVMRDWTDLAWFTVVKEPKTAKKFSGSRTVEVGPVTIGCMAPEARDLMETILDAYTKKYEEQKKDTPPHLWKKYPQVSPDDVYGFVYWLTRYSGLVQPL